MKPFAAGVSIPLDVQRNKIRLHEPGLLSPKVRNARLAGSPAPNSSGRCPCVLVPLVGRRADGDFHQCRWACITVHWRSILATMRA